MAARHVYKDSDGKRLPSVTTIIGRWKESGGLIHWAWELGINGKDYRDERQNAADSGTIAHEMVEADLRGTSWTPAADIDADVLQKGRQAFEAYQGWRKQTKLKVLHAEVPLASAKHRFGGTLDAIGTVADGNGLSLLDWKSSGRLYPDYLYQIAAYGMLWEENYSDQPITAGYHLCRFSKQDGDFSHSFFPSLQEEAKTFLLMRELYDRVKITEKRVR